MLDYANDIIDYKIKDRKEAEKKYLDRLNYHRELFYSLKNRDRHYEWWFDLYNNLKDAVFGKFKTKKDILLAEDEKFAIAQGGISESESGEETTGKGLKIMTSTSALVGQRKPGSNIQKLKNEI